MEKSGELTGNLNLEDSQDMAIRSQVPTKSGKVQRLGDYTLERPTPYSKRRGDEIVHSIWKQVG